MPRLPASGPAHPTSAPAARAHRSNSHRLEIIIIALIVIEILLELLPHGAIPRASLRLLRRLALPLA